MRILAIGMGGAGGRIAGALYANDRKSSKVNCVYVLVIDIDREALTKLQALPENTKIDLTPVEPGFAGERPSSYDPISIDTAEIIARVQNMDHGEIDAILICCGLGGIMAGGVPDLVQSLRHSVTEPIFALVTLPALSEGERRTVKAAVDLDTIFPLVDGTILFDNETWLEKIAARRDELVEELSKGPGILGLGQNPPNLTPEEITYKLLNQSIIRRISLLLRAGEFRADGGIDLAEVVMDSSEILNTIKGMGFISIGYAVEHIGQGPFAFLTKLRRSDPTIEQRKSAERIIELAKKAIYHEVSIPCDMTSAAKALILVAGPSHEISMKGFMTVRKWIDRSIAGMEMRSGDYPVTNSENVAIIVVLAGLDNIPRITEIRDIREQYMGGHGTRRSQQYPVPSVEEHNEIAEVFETTEIRSRTDIQDEMIVFPKEGKKKRISVVSTDSVESNNSDTPYVTERESVPVSRETTPLHTVRPRIQEETRGLADQSYTERTIPLRKPETSRERPVMPSRPSSIPSETTHQIKKPMGSGYEGKLPVKPRVQDHRAIIRDLEGRQKSGKPLISSSERKSTIPLSREKSDRQPEVRVSGTENTKIPGQQPLQKPSTPISGLSNKVVIKHGKKPIVVPQDEHFPEFGSHTVSVRQEELETSKMVEETGSIPPIDERIQGIKERAKPVRDDIFQGKTVRQKEPLRVKDSALLHTDIKTKKPSSGSGSDESTDKNEPVESKKKSGK